MNSPVNSPWTLAKLKWQCRRGTKELDTLLEGYLEKHYSQLPTEEQSLFIELLAYQDSQLILLLLGDQQPKSKGMARLVTKICKHKNI